MNRFEEFSNTYQILEKLGEGSGGSFTWHITGDFRRKWF